MMESLLHGNQGEHYDNNNNNKKINFTSSYTDIYTVAVDMMDL